MASTYASLNNHETARRRIWTEVYAESFKAWMTVPAPRLPHMSAEESADRALKQFDARFPPPEPPSWTR